MARGRMYYEQRMRASRVSQHTLPPLPEPTLADTLATVYHQRWRLGDGSTIAIDVLARNAAHAVVLGEMIVAGSFEPPFDLEVNVACPDASIEVKARILRSEPAAVFEDRQRRFDEGLRKTPTTVPNAG